MSVGTARAGDPGGSQTGSIHSHADGPGIDHHGKRPSAAMGDVYTTPTTWSASEYDGKQLATDAPDLMDAAKLPQFHAVYMYPSDGVNRFAQFAAKFQADARATSSALGTWYGRGLRWDERLGSDGSTRFLDITVVKAKANTRTLAGSKQFSTVQSELTTKGLTNSNKKYLVWLDASSSYCGQSSISKDASRSVSNLNNRRTTAVVYRYKGYSQTDPTTGGWCGWGTALHEMAHSLGAVQSVAPNIADYTHCDDNANDILCGYASTIPYDASKPRLFDYGNDDYWDPAADPSSGSNARLGWWTVNLNRFVCPTLGCGQPNDPVF